MGKPKNLPAIRIVGPRSMWELETELPKWKGDHDDSANGAELHPLRDLLIDTRSTEVGKGVDFFRSVNWPFAPETKVVSPAAVFLPRALSAIVAGKEGFTLRLRFRKADATPDSEKGDGKLQDEAVTVVLEPIPDKDEAWPKPDDLDHFPLFAPGDHIVIPDHRLLLGDLQCNLESGSDVGKRLVDIGWKKTPLRLTPDGIVLECSVDFPGTGTLDGLFLLYAAGEAVPPGDTGLRLRLLVDDLDDVARDRWTKAWLAVTPKPAVTDSSLRVAARRSDVPPAFTWSIEWNNKSWRRSARVDVPPEWVESWLVGRRVGINGPEPDGSARLLAARVTLENGEAGAVILSGLRGSGKSVRLTMQQATANDPTETLAVTPEAGSALPIPLRHDSRDLAAALRGVQGDRAPLFGFVAADRGWLQLPLPNVPPLDPQLDKDLANAAGPRQASALDGFARWSATVDPTLVSPTTEDPASVKPLDLTPRAPWSVTVEQAAGFTLAVQLRPGASDARIETWRVDLLDPEISTRGLLWVSVDHPDGNEALPRFGAGPGSFVDVPFEIGGGGDDGTEARFQLASLVIDPRNADLSARRMSMRWQPPEGQRPEQTWAWLRHPQMPLAATMPMTRSGGQSAEPLESRDLAPFFVDAPETLLSFGKESLLAGTEELTLKRLPQWPWNPLSDGEPVGVAFAAVGVPGAEVRPSDGGWAVIESAYRYDLPLLDEAFATAKLPKDEDGAAPPPSPDPPVTALDRDRIEEFWRDRARKGELTRVEDSYLAIFEHSGEVKNLIAPATWSVAVELELPADSDGFPYGRLRLGDHGDTFTGDAALSGLDAGFTRTGATLTRDGGNLSVRGFTPSTYVDDSLLFDNRGFGSTSESETDDHVERRRRVSVRGAEYALVTRLGAIPLQIGSRSLELWVKDLPFDAAGKLAAAEAGDLKAWGAEHAPLGGYEVRLLDPLLPGSDRIPLWGFELELLSITAASFTPNAGLGEVVLDCRLRVPAGQDRLRQSGHIVRLTFQSDGAAWKLSALTVVAAAPVVLRDKKLGRLMKIEFTPLLTGAAKLQLSAATLEVTAFGSPWTLGLDPIELAADDTAIHFPRKEITSTVAAPGAQFVGHLFPTSVEASIATQDAALTLSWELRVANGDGVMLARLPITEQADSLELLGFTVSTEEPEDEGRESAGALVRKLGPIVTGQLCTGFSASPDQSAKGLLAVTLIHREQGSDAPLPVSGGHLELEIAGSPSDAPGVAMRSIRIAFGANVRPSVPPAEGANPDRSWRGGVELYGSMRLASAIRWPIDWTVDPPVPKKKDPSRVNVKVTATQGNSSFAAHVCTLIFDGQVMRLEDFAAGAGKRLNGLARRWDALVVARHELRRASLVFQWSSVEAFGLVTFEELAGTQAKNFLGTQDVHVEAAFVAAERIEKAGAKVLLPRRAIFKPGFGRRADVLAGAESRPFRDALRTALDDQDAPSSMELVAVGGFAGVVDVQRNAMAGHRLLRVPFLARLHTAGLPPPSDLLGPNTLSQVPPAATQFGMPWQDTRLAPRLQLSTRHAVTPKDSRAESLWRLLLSDRTSDASTQAEEIEAAVLAEQAFIAGTFGDSPPLATTPFWIGAALAIDELTATVDSDGGRRAFSLIAGRAAGRRSAAAVVALDPNPAGGIAVPPPAAAMITLGDDVMILPFAGGADSHAALVRLATARHPVPRVVVLRRVDAGAVTYDIAPVPPPLRSELPQPDSFIETEAAFPVAQRGYPCRPFSPQAPKLSAGELSWSAGMIQGGTEPIFDRQSTGLAGLASSVALPRYAEPRTPEGSTSPLLWLGEKRAAPYLPLHLAPLAAPPLRWLTVVPTRERLPIASEVTNALSAAGVGEDAPTRAVLPDGVSLASVSERAGVLTARRVQLLAQVPDTKEIDPSFARFGVPAQGSVAPLRQIRTPRPGRLPDDRHTRASILAPKKVARYVRGSGESVCGRNEQAKEWCALIMAMPATGGVVSNRWDGSVRLRFEIISGGDEVVQPLQWLFAVDAGKLRSRAWLRVGDTNVVFRRIRFEKPLLNTATRYVGDVVLDIDEAQRKTTGLLPEAAALNAVPPPEVTLHLLVHLDDTSNVEADGKTLPLATDDGSALPDGKNRPPVTLSWPLATVSTERGALPLRPLTIVFIDPAYDAELSGEPLEARLEVTHQPNLPQDRGRLQAVLSVDRRAAQIDERLALMVDLRFERRLPDGNPAADDIQLPPLKPAAALEATATLSAQLVPRSGPPRSLCIARGVRSAAVRIGRVHELSLAALCEIDDGGPVRPVRWQPGDRLSLQVVSDDMRIRVIGPDSEHLVSIDSRAPLRVDIPVSSEPSFEPPPALYAVMKKVVPAGGVPTALSIPLFAQSPQATRIDAENLRDDFRRGLVRREATFLWRTAWLLPADGAPPSIYVVKQDRNGQTHLPDKDQELVNLESPLAWL